MDENQRRELLKRIMATTPETVEEGDEERTVGIPAHAAYNATLGPIVEKAKSMLPDNGIVKSIVSNIPSKLDETESVKAVKERLNRAYTPEGIVENFQGAASGTVKNAAQLLQERQAAKALAQKAIEAKGAQVTREGAMLRLKELLDSGQLNAAQAYKFQKATGKPAVLSTAQEVAEAKRLGDLVKNTPPTQVGTLHVNSPQEGLKRQFQPVGMDWQIEQALKKLKPD